jgi:purine/pyrimidine-nucleoside phosphorylase
MIEKIDNVSIVLKANVYFDGRVVSHTIISKDGKKQTAGLIYPGTYIFNTGAPERMDIVSGSCTYKIKGSNSWKICDIGSGFDVPANSSFEIKAELGITEYLCSYK